MSNPEIDISTINIMEREFKIKCPLDKTAELQKAADYLNDKMQDIQHGDKSITIDRVAIAAALNIAHELIIEKKQLRSQSSDTNKSSKRFLNLKNKLDEALASTA